MYVQALTDFSRLSLFMYDACHTWYFDPEFFKSSNAQGKAVRVDPSAKLEIQASVIPVQSR